MDGYCSTCFKKQSGVKEPPRWEHFDGGWVRFSKQVSSELERMRKMKKSKLSYGQGQHPQRIDLRALTMTPTRGPRQGRASKLRRVPPTHEGTFLTEEEWQEQKKAEDERKAAEDAEAEAKAKVESDMAAAMSKTRCCFAGCKKKLKLADTPCRCNLRFCRAHRLPENHNCTYNFKQRAVQNLCERADGGGRFDQLKTQSRDRL